MLNSRASNPLKSDPTRTATLRRKFETELRKRFNRLRNKLEKLIVEEDSFGLKPRNTNFLKLVRNQQWQFLTDEAKLQEFEKWLQQETGLTIIPEEERFWEDYVRQGYEKGASRAYDAVKKTSLEGSDVERAFNQGGKREYLRASLGAPESVAKVKLLASRVLTDLKGVTEVVATQLRKELVDGLVQGDNPRTISRRISDRLDISRGRAETIARTEVIRAHAEGQLDSMERLGVERINVVVEWSTAGDTRVCPQCAPLEGIVLEIKEAHNLIPRHPNCRCAFVPANVGESQIGQVRGKGRVEAAIEDSLKAEGGKKRTIAQARKRSNWSGATKKIQKKRTKSIV